MFACEWHGAFPQESRRPSRRTRPPLAGFTRSFTLPRSPLVENSFVAGRFPRKAIPMRYRARVASIARTKVGKERKRAHRRTLALIIAIASVPLLGIILAVVSTTKPELSELIPSSKQVGGYIVLNWAELLQMHRNDLSPASAELSGAAVRALGYMADGDKPVHASDLVQDFVLLPEAGNLLDPAHRFGDQMIRVHLNESDRIPFSPGQLIWVWGTFRASRGDPSGPTPLYSLEGARAQAADRADIARYFQ
jgi:hypothetical protein